MEVIINKIMIEFKKIDKSILRIVIEGLKYCMLFLLLPILVLIFYNIRPFPSLYYIGISLLKSCIFFITMFISCRIRI